MHRPGSIRENTERPSAADKEESILSTGDTTGLGEIGSMEEIIELLKELVKTPLLITEGWEEMYGYNMHCPYCLRMYHSFDTQEELHKHADTCLITRTQQVLEKMEAWKK